MTLEKVRNSIALAAVVAVGAGCSTWSKLDDTERGAVIGGGTGAVVGGAVSDSTAGTLVGGALGAVGGGLIGREVERDGRDDRYVPRR